MTRSVLTLLALAATAATCGGGSSTSALASTTTAPGAALTGTYGPGPYCIDVVDLGNLVAAATFVVTIAHP